MSSPTPKVGVDVAPTPKSPSTASTVTVKTNNAKKVIAGVIVGAAVITAIAVPLSLRNKGVNSSVTSAAGNNQRVEVVSQPIVELGCADGTREWFRNTASFQEVAGCAGAWTNPGLVTRDAVYNWAVPKGKTGDSNCTGIGNSATSNSAGTGCNAADLCATGWHVCESQAEVGAKSSTGTCDSSNQSANGPWGFFATAQTGRGWAICDQRVGSFNDVFGCGDDGDATIVDTATCAPLDRFSNNLCGSLASENGWTCGSDSYGESLYIVHSNPRNGGVLCCKDDPVPVCTVNAEGWTVTGVEDFVSFLIQGGSYTSVCDSVSGTSLNIVSSSEVPTEFSVSLYRAAASCSGSRPDAVVSCPAYVPTDNDNEYEYGSGSEEQQIPA